MKILWLQDRKLESSYNTPTPQRSLNECAKKGIFLYDRSMILAITRTIVAQKVHIRHRADPGSLLLSRLQPPTLHIVFNIIQHEA
jgi:hypothetical protein